MDHLIHETSIIQGLQTSDVCKQLLGYDSFVEAATGLWSNFNPVQQHEIVAKTLDKAIPRPILAMASSSFSSHRLRILTYVENAQVYRIQVMMP